MKKSYCFSLLYDATIVPIVGQIVFFLLVMEIHIC
jgi:hypothetical protein